MRGRPGDPSALVRALCAVALVALCARVLGTAQDLAVRLLLAAALPLYALDQLRTARIATGTGPAARPDRVGLALSRAWLAAALIALAAWRGTAEAVPVVLGALAAGAAIGLASTRLPVVPVAGDLHDLSRPPRGWRHLLYRLWPVASLAFVLVLTLAPPDGGWPARALLAQMVVLPFLVQRFPPNGGGGLLRAPIVPRLAGVALIAAALLLP